MLITACKESTEKKISIILDGDWSIDSISYEDKNIIGCMLINTMYFYNDSVVKLPTTSLCNDPGLKTIESFGTYKVVYNASEKSYLRVQTKNKLFDDSLEIQFVDDLNNRLIKLELKSEKCYLLITKGGSENYTEFKHKVTSIFKTKEIISNRITRF